MSRVETVNRISLSGLVLLGLCALVGHAAVADDAKSVRVDRVFGGNQPEMFVADEFIVVLNADARGNATAGADQFGPTVNLPSLQEVVNGHGVARFARQFPTAQAQPAGGRFHDLTGHYKAKIGPGVDLDVAMAAFARNPHVDHVEKIGIHPIYYCATGTPSTPNDTYYDNPPLEFDWPQWDLWDNYGIDADLAWTDQTGDEAVVVVAMDSGVRYFHKDLGGNDPPGPADNVTDGNVWVNAGETPNNGTDDDGNGYVDDVVGWDFVTGITGCTTGEDCSTPDNDPRDFNGHGTHTAGTMAAITNNARSVAGIAGGFGDGTTGSAGNGAKIMCMRIGWDSPQGGYVRMDFAAEAMNYVTDMKTRGVNVAAVNASWGSSNSGGIDAAVDNLLAADVMLIHAAGNSPTGNPDYLGAKAGVMNVAATDPNGYKASFSNYGSWVDIAAPGVDIISTYHHSGDPSGDYVAVMDGTSMASPHVAGVAALLESCDNGLSGPDKFSIMVNNGCAANSPDIGDILNARLSLDAVPGGCGCTSDPECDDSNECTDDACVAGSCENTPVADNTACSGGVCCGGTCTAPACSSHGDCDDADLCTTDTCTDPGLCSAACVNDPIVCPPDETCVDGVCVPEVCNNDTTCDPGEDCINCPADCISGGGVAVCGDGICQPATGEDCLSCPSDCNGKQVGAAKRQFCCGDGAGTNPVGCDDPRCTTDPWMCSNDPADPYCCGDGTCEGEEDVVNCAVDCGCTVPADCDDLNECTIDDCVGGVCENTPVADDTSCTGGICCGGTCDAAVCSNDGDCADSEGCTTDTCYSADTCSAYCDNVWPACGPSDGCCGPTCDSSDPDCDSCVPAGGYCTSNADCCSNSCHPAKDYCR